MSHNFDSRSMPPGRTGRSASRISCIFVDIGGVLLTNGWDRLARRRAARNFQLDGRDMDERHQLVAATYEEGKLTLEEYLERVIFHQPRSFTRMQFRNYMFAQSTLLPGMIPLLTRIKARHGLKIAVVSNEGRELNAKRIATFRLDSMADFFVSSCFIGMRKPDVDVFRLALNLAQVPAEKVLFIENTPLFLQVAGDLGIRGILHTSLANTRTQLDAYGLQDPAETHRVDV